MRIAILGATSQIAQDFVRALSMDTTHHPVLFAKRPLAVAQWLNVAGLTGRFSIHGFEDFTTSQEFDALINFVGVGNPARALAMGTSILDVTHQFDQLALDYIQAHPGCRYVFISSGAAYGANFAVPANVQTRGEFPINSLQPQDWYGVAKLYAECRHRAFAHLAIVDVRVFNYFSRSQDMSARFLISDILRSIREQSVLQTSADPMVRDFLHPADFHQLISKILAAPATNMAVDCYSREPISKAALLSAMQSQFGLRYDVRASAGVNATGIKTNYYSTNRKATEFGYAPSLSSWEGIKTESNAILSGLPT